MAITLPSLRSNDLKIAAELVKLTPSQARLVRQALEMAPSLFAFTAEQIGPILASIESRETVEQPAIEKVELPKPAIVAPEYRPNPVMEVMRKTIKEQLPNYTMRDEGGPALDGVPVKELARQMTPTKPDKPKREGVKVYGPKVLEVASLDPTNREDLNPLEGWVAYPCIKCSRQFLYPSLGRMTKLPKLCLDHVGVGRAKRLDKIEQGLRELGDLTTASNAE